MQCYDCHGAWILIPGNDHRFISGARALERTKSGSARFHEILGELGVLHDKKQADYGRPADPFANIRASSDFGIKPWVGAMIRANDKMRRIQKFASEGNLANETVEDSFRDLAVYVIIALVLYEESRQS